MAPLCLPRPLLAEDVAGGRQMALENEPQREQKRAEKGASPLGEGMLGRAP